MTYQENNEIESITRILLQEFQALRNEIVETIKSQYTVLSIGAAVISGLFMAAFVQQDRFLRICILFLIPFLSTAYLGLWGVEISRRLRAASYIYNEIEPKLNALHEKKLAKYVPESDHRVLNWERWLREEKSHELKMWNTYHYNFTLTGIIAIFFGAAVTALSLNGFYIFLTPVHGAPPFAVYAALLLLFGLPIPLLYVTNTSFRVVKKERTLIKYANMKPDL